MTSLHLAQTGRRRRATPAIEHLERRITLSHVTIFGANVPHGFAGHVDHGTTTGVGHAGHAASATLHHGHHKAAHDKYHLQAVTHRAPVAFLVSGRSFAVKVPGRAIAAARQRGPNLASGGNGRRMSRPRYNVTFDEINVSAVRVATTPAASDHASIEHGGTGAADNPTGPVALAAVRDSHIAVADEPAVAAFGVDDPCDVTPGMSFNGTMTARDAYGNTVTGFDGTVILTGHDGLPVHSVAQTAFTNGMAILAAAFHSPESANGETARETDSGAGHSLLITRAAISWPINPGIADRGGATQPA
jgi:hypothetical protein